MKKGNKKKIVSKGYTLSVTSWENDGDNYKTKSHTYDSKELAIAVAKMCRTIFKSCNNGDGGIGNTNERDESEAQEVIIKYMKKHPELYPDEKNPSDDELVDICMDYNYTLMGNSEYYYSRVFERLILTYSPEDIYLEEIPV